VPNEVPERLKTHLMETQKQWRFRGRR